MRTYKDTGITFKQNDLNEADRIISVLTKYHGRVDAIAKGIRKITSRKGGNIDLITLSKFAFAKGKNLDIVTEAELIESYTKLKRKLKPTMTLFYICELLDNFLKLGEKQRAIFELLLELLETLKKSNTQLPLRAFELKLIASQGFEPNLKTCLVCDKEFEEGKRRYLAFNQFGFLCSKERRVKGEIISDKTLKILRFLRKKSISESISLKADKKLEKELEKITQRWIEMIVEKDLKSKRYLNKDTSKPVDSLKRFVF